MQSPKDDFGDPPGFGHPSIRRTSEKPGTAVTSARPRSFSRQKAARTSRITSYMDDDNEEEKEEGRSSASAVQAAKAAVATSRAAAHRVTQHGQASRGFSGASGADGSAMSGSAGRMRRSGVPERGLARGGSRGLGSPSKRGRGDALHNQFHPGDHLGVGTSLLPIDTSIQPSVGTVGSSGSALDSATSTRAVGGSGSLRRGSSVRVGDGSGAGATAALGFDDSPTNNDPASFNGQRGALKRRSSTPNLSMAASGGSESNHDSLRASAGTPASVYMDGNGHARTSSRGYRRSASSNRVMTGSSKSMHTRGKG